MEKISRNLPWKDTTKYDFLCLSYSSTLTILHTMMIRKPFLTKNKVKWGYPGFVHIYFIKEHQKRIEEILYTLRQNPFATIPSVVSTISLPQQRILFWFLHEDKGLQWPDDVKMSILHLKQGKIRKNKAYIRHRLRLNLAWLILSQDWLP